ncbi:33kDa venom protein-like [Chelonus insularis]|uniref:33kDa venom protein-like n=1 Tax=Chelonus insularis TaxID=460826 RepID=UPI00158B7BCD|nr:33kDa venom protein-like [Chelonus insularis]
MAGKEMIFIAALFIVVQSTPRFSSFDDLSCPSTFSLKTSVKKNECTKKEDCHRARYVCCENQEKVNVCAEGVFSPSNNNLDTNKKATVESKSMNNPDKSIPVPTESTNGDDDVEDDVDDD